MVKATGSPSINKIAEIFHQMPRDLSRLLTAITAMAWFGNQHEQELDVIVTAPLFLPDAQVFSSTCFYYSILWGNNYELCQVALVYTICIFKAVLELHQSMMPFYYAKCFPRISTSFGVHLGQSRWTCKQRQISAIG